MGRDDIYFIDSPVSGGAGRAADGTLSIMAGAPPEAMDKGKFLLQEMAADDKLFITGGIGAGSNMKMVHQVLAGIHILVSSESMGLAARMGLDAKEVREKVVSSDSWGWMFEHRTPRMLEEDYFPGVSALTIILKDVVSLSCSIRGPSWQVFSPDLTLLGYHHINGQSPLRPRKSPRPFLDCRTYFDYLPRIKPQA